MFVKLGAYGRYYFYERWNIFDCVVVTSSVVDLLNTQLAGGEKSQAAVFRVLRVLRVARIIRLVRLFRQLVLIVKGILDALSTIFWVSLLLIMFIFIAGIFFATQIGAPDAPYQDFLFFFCSCPVSLASCLLFWFDRDLCP